jgi:hypothetical protein
MDNKGTGEVYRNRVKQMNPILEENFKPLFTKVRKQIEEHTGFSVLDLEGYSLPGFHIFGSHPSFIDNSKSVPIHYDFQYRQVAWPCPPVIETVISFTLALELPADGSGLNWWEIDHEAFKNVSKEEEEKMFNEAMKFYLPYEVGTLVIHSGHLLHQIAPPRVIPKTNDRRITLQGHAALAGNSYYWFW